MLSEINSDHTPQKWVSPLFGNWLRVCSTRQSVRTQVRRFLDTATMIWGFLSCLDNTDVGSMSASEPRCRGSLSLSLRQHWSEHHNIATKSTFYMMPLRESLTRPDNSETSECARSRLTTCSREQLLCQAKSKFSLSSYARHDNRWASFSVSCSTFFFGYLRSRNHVQRRCLSTVHSSKCI